MHDIHLQIILGRYFWQRLYVALKCSIRFVAQMNKVSTNVLNIKHDFLFAYIQIKENTYQFNFQLEFAYIFRMIIDSCIFQTYGTTSREKILIGSRENGFQKVCTNFTFMLQKQF